MKILFIGTVLFSFKTLEKLIYMHSNIVGVCTKQQSNFNSDFKNLVPICKTSNIPFKLTEDINSEDTIEWIKQLKPDIIFCFGWSSLIKKELLDLAPMGVVGYHPAFLPQNRGRHPLIWALVLGLKKSASTFFFMEEGADDGDILSQVKFDILYDDDAQILYNKVIDVALKQMEEFIPQLESGIYQRIKQNHELANTWRKRSRLDGLIDFRMSSIAIYNLVRGLTKPYIGANILYNNKDVIFWKVEVIDVDLPNIEYGKVLEIENNTILIKTFDTAIRVLEHTFDVLPEVGEYL